MATIKGNSLRLSALIVAGLACFTSFSVQAVPVTKSTKHCKPLIDVNKKAPQIMPQGLPERVHSRMNRALEALAEERYEDAIERLNRMSSSARSDFVKSSVSLNLAHAHIQKGDQEASLPHFEDALKFGVSSLPHERTQSIRLSLASLFYTTGKSKQALETMLSWLDNSVVHDPKSYAMIAALYAEKGKSIEATCPSFWSVKTSKEPNKVYYQNLLKFHWDQKDLDGAAMLLKEMVEYFPEEKTFWRQLSQIYLHLDRIDDALAIMEMFYLKGGFDKGTDYQSMSSLFAYREIPYRAASMMEEGLKKGIVEEDKKNWNTIAQYYHLSNELDKAIDAYGITANLSDTGVEYLKQAEILSEEERYREAIEAFDKAIQKGGLNRNEIGTIHYKKGTALVNLGRCSAGITELGQAQKYKKFRSQARHWISFTKDRERNNKC